MALRPLQPAPVEQEQASQPQSRPVLTQKPKRTVTLGACVACRKRKSKCDGQRPVCTCCTQKDTECIYELGPNEKPSQAMKRKNEEMQGDLTNLRQLYDFLRLRPEQEALEILRRIRANPSDATPSQRIQELADFVRHGDLLIQPPHEVAQQEQTDNLTLPPIRLPRDSPLWESASLTGSQPSLPNSLLSMGFDGPMSQRRRHASDADVSARSDSQGNFPHPISMEAILHEPSYASLLESADPRLESAVMWTNVTSDSSLVVPLMAAWHTWEYKYHHFLDWDIFLEDLVAKRNVFCSELLVNALLASASFHSPVVKDRAKPFADNVLTLFYKEARRLWEFGEGVATLPRLQAALLLYMVLGKHGRDKVGQMFILEACRIAHELNLFRFPPAMSLRVYKDVPLAKLERVRSVTAWALFNFQLSVSITYSFPTIMKMQPPLAVPYEDTPDSEAMFRSECAKNVILIDCVHLLMDADGSGASTPPKPELVEVLYLRLKSWWSSRPAVLNPAKHPSPENLFAAMQYHSVIIRMLKLFLKLDTLLENGRAYHEHARATVSASLKDLRLLLTLHETHHGWSSAIPYVLDAIMICSFGTLEEITQGDSRLAPSKSDEPYQGIMTCLRALSSLSCFIFYAQPLFRLLTQTCQSFNIQLPIEALSTLDHYRSDVWTKNAANLVSSQYVTGIAKLTPGIDMDSIISQWDALTMSESSGGTSSRWTSPDVEGPQNV